MKIAIFHDFLIEKGGGERIISILSKYLKDVKIFTSLYIPENVYETFSSKNVISVSPHISKIISKFDLVKILFTLLFFGKIMKNYKRIINKNYDVAIFSGFYSIILAPFLSIPKVYYINSEPFDEALRREKYSLYTKIFKKLILRYSRIEKLALRNMNIIVAISRYTKELYESYGIKVQRVIYPPVEMNRFKCCKKNKNSGEYFLFVGRLLPHKRPELLLRVFSKIKDENLLIVGDGPLLRLVKIYSNKFKNISYIRGTTISDEELSKIYCKSKAVIYITEREPFGLVPVEANSCGRPAIVSNEGGLKETIIDKKTGLVLDPDYEKNLEKVIKNFGKYRFSQKICRKNAKRFDVDIFIKKFKSVLSEIMNYKKI